MTTISKRDHEAITKKIERSSDGNLSERSSYFGLGVWMVDADMKATTNIKTAKWIWAENYYGYALMEIGADGEVTLVGKEL